MNSPTDFSAAQLAAARSTAWHQDGRGLLTIEGARNWVDHYGLVLFAPLATKLGAPAPSFIEATLGAANDAPTLAESATARSLAARLIAEGTVLPLNLLGSTGDQPDFLASAKVFSYVFTMRGDKTWKQAPSTSGATKVAPLAVSVWEALSAKGAMSAAELTSELGREVTESAIARALNELWAQLRVIPQLQQDENQPTLWELASKRFSKAVKAGMNAGQPSAMSALLSLYLSQAISATEEEAAGFLSPLTARSRVREVIHALIAGRQITESVVDGKNLLFINGTLPEFAPTPVAEPVEGAEEAAVPFKKMGTGRISSFSGERKPRTDFKGKPAFGDKPRRTSSAGPRPSRPFGAKPEGERRPFKRSDDAKPSFTRPWEEDKRPRAAAEDGTEAPRERKPYERKSFGDKPAYGAKKTFGNKPSFSGDRKPYGERTYGGSDSKPRPSFGDKPAFGDRKPYERKSFGDKPAYGAKKSFGDRPARPFGDRPSKPFGERKSFGDRPARPYTPRTEEGGERKPFRPRTEGGFDRPARSYGDRPSKPFGERKSFGDRPARPFGDRPAKPFGERKSFGDRPARPFGDRPSKPFGERKSFGDRPSRPYTPRTEEGGERKPFRPRTEGGFDRPARGENPRTFGSKPAFGSKPSFGAKKPFGAKPGGAKFGAGKPAGKFGGKPGGFSKRPSSGAPFKRKPASEE